MLSERHSTDRKPVRGETRSIEQLREQYEIEKELAGRLRRAPREERRRLYSSLYDELFRRVPHHPQLTRKASPLARKRAVARQIAWLEYLCDEETTFLEIGAGDCALAFEVARFAGKVYAVDVSEEITRNVNVPPNVEILLSDGCTLPVPPDSVHVTYSNQVMEHLHPDDALEQLRNIHAALQPGGLYICQTPNRIGGPHDISRYFDSVAVGFHLKEYSLAELTALFRRVGFTGIRVFAGVGGQFLTFPTLPFVLLERLLSALPRPIRNRVARSRPVSMLLGIRLVGRKAPATARHPLPRGGRGAVRP